MNASLVLAGLSFIPLASLLALATPSVAAAQPPGPNPGGRVTVTGTGEVRVAPDMAVVTVEAAAVRPTPHAAAEEARKALDAALKAAHKAVRDTADLRTARVSLNAEYDWADGKRSFRGYAASQTLEITVRDLAKLETLLDDLFKTSIHGLNGPDFRHSAADSLRREAGARAVRDAAANAAALCRAAARSCDEVTAIRMAGIAAPGPFPVAEFKAMRASDAGGAMPVQPGLLTFSASVEADYRLE